jgi:hypothetical protein
MPCVFGCNSEVLLQKCVASHHIHYDFFVARARLIIRGPSTIDKFKLTRFYKLPNFLFSKVGLKVPPTLEVVHLGLRKPTLGVLLQCFYDRCYDLLNFCFEIEFWGHLPAHIIMRVANQMHMDLISIHYWIT